MAYPSNDIYYGDYPYTVDPTKTQYNIVRDALSQLVGSIGDAEWEFLGSDADNALLEARGYAQAVLDLTERA